MPAITVQNAFELAIQHQRAGRLAEAETLYRQILAVQPNHAAVRSNLGEACRMMKRFDEAVAEFEKAIRLQPDTPEIHYNLGVALVGLDRMDEALRAFQQAIQIKPDYAEAHNNCGNVLMHQGRKEDAAAAFRRALEINPEYAPAHNNLGNLRGDAGDFEAAIAAYRRALEIKPDYAEAYNNLGHNLAEVGRFGEAVAALDRALAIRPDYPSAKFNAAFVALLRGDFDRGWPWYEARWEVAGITKPVFSQPTWDGGPLNGQRLLIYAEQGFGDSLQFIRYAALAAARGGEIIVVCPRSLKKLFRTMKDVHAVIGEGEALPPFDVQVPMVSLPLVLQTKRESIPREIPYLFADPSESERWKILLGAKGGRLRVGLAWAGGQKHRRNRMRNIPLPSLLPLWRVEGVDFFSLQVDAAGEEMRRFSEAAAIIDHTESIGDFADTAAFMMELDLVITIDSAVAHLTGALGRPVWTLLPFVPDWRWGFEGEDTPWYPTMRLFRQPTVGDWDSVVRCVESELSRLSLPKVV